MTDRELLKHLEHLLTVLAGIAIPIAKWKSYESEIKKIKLKYALQNSEIHTAYILRPIIEQNHIDQTKAKRTIEEEAFIQVISRFEQYLKI